MDVELDLDTSAKLGLTLQDTVTTDTTVNGTENAFGGCVDMTTGLLVQAVANGGFFNIFNEAVKVPLFDKQFTLFQVRQVVRLWFSG